MSNDTQTFNCQGTGPSILPINNLSCGVRGAHANFTACCGTATTHIQRDCYQYCEYSSGIAEWVQCLAGEGGTFRTDIFCQSSTNATVNRSIAGRTSNTATKPASLKWSLLLSCLLMVLMFGSGTSAQSSSTTTAASAAASFAGCQSYTETRQFTRAGDSVVVSSTMKCRAPAGCAYNATLTATSNRTLTYADTTPNRIDYMSLLESPSDPANDEIFTFLESGTNITFQAETSVTLVEGFVLGDAANGRLGWAPYLLCSNGTATGCSGDGPLAAHSTDGAINIEACSPMLVEGRNVPDGEFFISQFS